jgi:DNA mismatch repair protein MutS2
VRALSGGNVDVEVRGMRMRVPLSGLRRPSKGASREAGRPASGRGGSPASRAEGALVPAAAELVVIGATVDDALDRVEKFLDASILTDAKRLRIVHGHGTGRLREAIRTRLKTHPLVATAAPAPDNEGGQGATIVELRD